MTNGKHTPGPWYEAKTGNHQGLIVDEKTGDNIAVAYDKVNARLIAAAPRMLEMLKAIQGTGLFSDNSMATCYLSAHPRRGRELDHEYLRS
jgi:hypothetical protein